MQERLQKILSRAGVSSRRAAEKMIVAGRVAVNGVVVQELGAKADPAEDTITVDGRVLNVDAARVYLVLYKPAGYMTTLKDPQGRPLVTDLVGGIRERVYPVGRLDYNTEGLLLLTNDGDWANVLAHPRHEVDKEYHVRVQGKVSPEQIERLAAGVVLEDGPTAAALVRPVRESDNNTWLSITIHEGRYRQVRRMCEAVNLTVVRLKRVRYGFLGLEGLKPGTYRFLTPEEVERLRREPGCGGKSNSSTISAEKRRELKQRGSEEEKNRYTDDKMKKTASMPGKRGGRRRQS
ncbi:MAG TPA: pseudouridine synthase [Geobacteraceae bacterium]|nr:pseudouridine synthase [Geobacteraceae bacterium]